MRRFVTDVGVSYLSELAWDGNEPKMNWMWAGVKFGADYRLMRPK
jgi:hypothetical protein